MSWREVELGSLLRIDHGFAFKGEHFGNVGDYIVLTPGNFHEQGGFRPRPGKDRRYAAAFPERYLLSANDLIVAMTEQGEGLLGSAALVPASDTYLHNQRIGLVRVDESRANKHFIYYLFNTPSVREQIRNSSSGAKVRHTSPERMYRVRAMVPEPAEQAKVAATLASLDDLIANNQRRIALLESMAEEIYREWFVRMRFPGYERAEFFAGRPVAWQPRRLGQVLQLRYGKALPEGQRVPGPYRVYGSAGVVGTHSEALVTKPSIVVGRKGNVGSIFWASKPFYPIDTVYYVESELPLIYLRFLLAGMNFINSDAAVPGLNREQAYANELLLPQASLLSRFEEVVGPLYRQIGVLEDQAACLGSTRGALLPRLISGKLRVDALDIQYPPGMQQPPAEAAPREATVS